MVSPGTAGFAMVIGAPAVLAQHNRAPAPGLGGGGPTAVRRSTAPVLTLAEKEMPLPAEPAVLACSRMRVNSLEAVAATCGSLASISTNACWIVASESLACT